MTDLNTVAFISLFKEGFEKCFGFILKTPLSETESRHFANAILEATGLLIGAKSIKNYSAFVLNPESVKAENPSPATLDTFARYVMNAPYTNETARKAQESHYPYWFQYKSKASAGSGKRKWKLREIDRKYILLGIVFITALLLLFLHHRAESQNSFTEDFHSVNSDTLSAHGWLLKNPDLSTWNKRNTIPGALTLFTLRGDNWPDSSEKPEIKNILFHAVPYTCFSAEMHMKDFVPHKEWQQAGCLLMEDTTFSSRCLRVSIAYNDFYGGFPGPPEIIVQAISTGARGMTHPEEIVHKRLYSYETSESSIVNMDMRYTALRIEKRGDHIRLLYSASPNSNYALTELYSSNINFTPKYVGLFALKGFVNDTTILPVRISYFGLTRLDCRD